MPERMSPPPIGPGTPPPGGPPVNAAVPMQPHQPKGDDGPLPEGDEGETE